MHGLIFETSVCYWQDQPDFYSSVLLGPDGDSARATEPNRLPRNHPTHGSPQEGNKRVCKGVSFCKGSLLPCRFTTECKKPEEKPLQRWSFWNALGTRADEHAAAATGPVPPLKRGTTEVPAESATVALHPGYAPISGSPLWFFSEAAQDIYKADPWGLTPLKEATEP